MANDVFQCDVNRGFLRKIDGNEKSLYLEISDTEITGKGIIYLESSQREYSGDINYEIKSIKKVEKSVYEGMDALIIYIRVASLYGAQKLQVRLPGLRDMPKALNILEDYLMDMNAASAPAPAPAPAAAPAPAPAPMPAAPAPAPAPAPMAAAPAPAPAPMPAAPMGSPAPAPMAAAPMGSPAPAPAPMPAAPMGSPAPAPMGSPAPAPMATASVISIEEYKKKLEKLEAIYQTGMITEKEYKTSKAEYISVLNGLDAFFNKVKVNMQYNEVGFLSATEFEEFKKSTISECSDLTSVSNEVMRQNLKKLLILYLFEIITQAEYDQICTDITRSVQYSSSDTEEMTIEKITKWPILKDCEIISEAQYEQFIKLVSDDTKIRMNESLPVLEHKLTRLTTLSKTFLFTPEEFASKKKELVDEMTALDFSSETKLRSQITCIVTLRKCGWIDDMEFQSKKNQIVGSVESNDDIVARLQMFRMLTNIEFLTEDEYKGYEKKVIDDIFQPYSDISELQKKAQNLMKLKDAAIISEDDFNSYKKRLLSLS